MWGDLMQLRSVLIFPRLDNPNLIHDFRREYDDLVDHIRPHIQLVFPFKSDSSDDNLISAVSNASQPFSPMKAKLGNAYAVSSAKTVEVEVLLAKPEIIKLHDNLYSQSEFTEFLNHQIVYRPHITIARNVIADQAEEIVNKYNGQKINSQLDISSVSIERILDNGDSDELYEYDLSSM